MKTIEKSPERLVVGGWKAASVLTGLACLAAPVAFYLLMVQAEPDAIWANLFIAVICGALFLRMVFWERIELDTDAGEVRFDQLRPLGRLRRSAPLKPMSRVEVETSPGASNGKVSRRLVLVTGDQRTPFTKHFSSARFEKEQAELNDWLRQVYGDRWRDAATGMVDRPRSEVAAEVPEGVTRIRHPRTGLTLDMPKDWSAFVSLDRSGPLRIFGVTLLERINVPGKKRPLGDGEDWNTLVVRGAEDAGLKLTIHDGPLDKTLEGILADPWSKSHGCEVLKTTPEVEIGGMHGFSVARRVAAGGTHATFGKVGAEAATRQLWLGGAHLHLEVVGIARVDHPDIQHAIDSMFASIRLPSSAAAP